MGKIILDKMAMQRALTRITYEIVEKNKGVDDLVMVDLIGDNFLITVHCRIGNNFTSRSCK